MGVKSITVQDIQRDPRDFLRRVESGESMVVVRDDHPVAEVRPVHADTREPRPFGLCAGQFNVPDDFDSPLSDDVLDDFEGR